MIERLNELKQTALRDLETITEASKLESWRISYLGRKSELTLMLRSLAQLPIEERKTTGAKANEIRQFLEAALLEKESSLQTPAADLKTGDENTAARQDITLPGRPLPSGRLHPITETLQELVDIFTALGFQIAEGPDVEWEHYNFTALNMPAEHPARDRMSTFWMDYVNDKGERPILLRTHTTSVTARTLRNNQPPIRAVEFGKVYRYEATDATHLTMLHMIDGVAVDKNITMADLKGTLFEFARRFFGEHRKARFRCDFFPFVEPGVELAIECGLCQGSGCRMCGNSGWIEVAGAGMTHPKVLEYGGIDTEEYTSFAFGFGVDRLPLLRYGIEDIRHFFGNDMRFLKQF